MTRRPSIPKGHRWTRVAVRYIEAARFWSREQRHAAPTTATAKLDRSLKRSCLRNALAVVYAHSRCAETRTEAKRLMEIVETTR